MTRFQTLPFFLFALAILAVGCGEDSNTQEKTTYDLDRPINEARLQLDAEPDRLNPLLTTSNYSNTVISQIFQYLIALNPASMEFEPQLAQSRAVVEKITDGPYAGGASYTFEIRPEARWSDGSAVTAEDYIFTLKAAFNPKVPATPYRVYLSFIKEVQVDSDNPRRFTVITDQQNIIGEEAIGAALPVMPAYHYDPDGLLRDIPLADLMDREKATAMAESDERLQQFADQLSSPRYNREPEGITGSGPYRLKSWETGQRVVLERKEDWWGDEVGGEAQVLNAYPEGLTFLPIADPNAVAAAVKDKQIDVAPNISPDQFNELKETDFVNKDYEFHSPSSLVHSFVYVNTRIPKLQDKKVRQALAYAIDVDEIINTVFSGLGMPSTGPVHPDFSYYNENVKPIPYEPETARKLLEEAGWTDSNGNGIVDKEINGELTEMELTYNFTAGRESSRNVGLLMQESAKQAGIKIEPVPQEHTVNMDALKRRDFELVGGAKSIQPLPWQPKQDFHSEGDDRSGFARPATDEMIDRIQTTLDPEARKEMYLELQEILHEEMPIIPIMIPKGRLVIHKRFETPITPVFPGYQPSLLKLEEPAQ